MYQRLSRARSGLGIEAQRQVLAQFAQAEVFEIAREFVEVDTGKGADPLDRRPQLKAALATARKLRWHVAVAKLDRPSRDDAKFREEAEAQFRRIETLFRYEPGSWPFK